MSKIKYTADGKKVVIIGVLNQSETIVQEIFITESGDEIPQGERFVVKNLLDEPAKSWQEKKLEELRHRFEKEQSEWEAKLNKLGKEKSLAYDALKERVAWLRNVAKEPREAEFKKVINLIADFLSDTEKWVFVANYLDWNLERFNENGVNSLIDRIDYNSFSRSQYDSMRLLSLYGNPDKSLVFKINEYYDGSGNNNTVEFFRSKQDALTYMQNLINDMDVYNLHTLKNAEKYGLKLDSSKLSAYYTKEQDTISKKITEHEEQIKNLKKQLVK